MKKTLIFLFTLSFISAAFAKGWDSVYINKLVSQGEIDKVIDYYKNNYASPERDPKDAFRIADLYTQKKDYPAAVTWYEKEKSYLKDSKTNLLNLALAYRMTGHYQKALDAYLMYAAETGDVATVMDEANLCERLIRASSFTDNYFFEPYKFNFEHDESQVSVLRGNLIYALGNRIIGMSRIWEAMRLHNSWLDPQPVLTRPDEKTLYHHMSFTGDGNHVIYAAKENPVTVNNISRPVYKLYFAAYLGGALLNVEPFPFNSAAYSCREAAYSYDGTEIYFSSDMPGGQGGFDIWKTSKVNGKWAKPENLGKLVNSKSDETSPYVFLEKGQPVMFFASDRDGGFGGFDIYRATYGSSTWQGVEMQPAPINSGGNENSFIYDPETLTGYVSTDRTGGMGGADIYRIRPLDLKLILLAQDSASKEVLDYSYIQLYDNNIKIGETVTGNNGISVMQLGINRNYTINISKDNYRPRTVTFNTKGKYNGDTVNLSVALLKDPQFSVKNSSTSISMQNYIVFMGSFKDAATNKAVRPDMRMVNLNTNKLRILDVDESGSFLIKLMTNNNYKIFIQNKDNKISDEITTYGLDHGSVKLKNYILSGTQFQTSDNRVMAPYAVPDSLRYLWKELPTPVVPTGSVLSTSLPDAPLTVADKTANTATASSATIQTPAETISGDITTGDNIYYKIQVGSYAAPASFYTLEGLGELQESIAYGNHIYRIGDFADINEAKAKLEVVRQRGYAQAFLLQYRKDKIISIIK